MAPCRWRRAESTARRTPAPASRGRASSPTGTSCWEMGSRGARCSCCDPRTGSASSPPARIPTRRCAAARNSAPIAYSRRRSSGVQPPDEEEPAEEPHRQEQQEVSGGISNLSGADRQQPGERADRKHHDRGDQDRADRRRPDAAASAAAAGDSAGAGCRPASPRYRPPATYWTRPNSIPTPADANPTCQLTF